MISKATHEARIKWLDYLREPGRKKYTRRLENPENPEERCCLGHGCHALKDSAHVTRMVRKSTIAIDETAVFYDGYETSLPHALVGLLGITPTGAFCNALDIDGESPACLAEVNDYTNFTMAEIATLIEEMFAEGAILNANLKPCEPWTRDMVPADS